MNELQELKLGVGEQIFKKVAEHKKDDEELYCEDIFRMRRIASERMHNRKILNP